jgi:hypothetical protein
MSWWDDNAAPTSRTADMRDSNGDGIDDRDQAGLFPGTKAPGAGGGYEPYSDQAFRAILESYPPTNDGIRAASEEAKRRFGPAAPELLDHPQRLDKFRMPDGRTFDVVGGAGGPNPTHAWMLEGPGHGGGGGGGAAGAMGGFTSGQFGPGNPFYDFPLQQGIQALERSAAAKGTLLGGGQVKAVTRYGQDYAASRLGDYWDRLYKTAGLGLNAAQSAGAFGTSYGNQVGNTGANYAENAGNLAIGRGNTAAAGQVAQNNAWTNTIGTVANGVMQMPWFNRDQQQETR